MMITLTILDNVQISQHIQEKSLITLYLQFQSIKVKLLSNKTTLSRRSTIHFAIEIQTLII